ncbi:MAG: hypothetical protein RI900_404 [Actinomycetota bacterium]|jgi:ABC-2 type transport system permease protein
MRSAIRSEFIKFRTVRMNWVLGIIAVLFPVVTTLLFAALAKEGEGGPPDLEALFRFLTITCIVMVMLVGVLGASGVTGEFAFNTIRPTFAATPRRSRVMLAKAVVTAVAGLGIATVVMVVGLFGGAAVVSGRGRSGSIGDVPNLGIATVGFVLFTVIVALLGLAVGMMVRSTPGSVAVIVLWPLLAENIIASVLGIAGVDDANRWMPYGAGGALWSLDDSPGGFGRWGGGAYFLAVTVGLLLVGNLITSRRDA